MVAKALKLLSYWLHSLQLTGKLASRFSSDELNWTEKSRGVQMIVNADINHTSFQKNETKITTSTLEYKSCSNEQFGLKRRQPTDRPSGKDGMLAWLGPGQLVSLTYPASSIPPPFRLCEVFVDNLHVEANHLRSRDDHGKLNVRKCSKFTTRLISRAADLLQYGKRWLSPVDAPARCRILQHNAIFHSSTMPGRADFFSKPLNSSAA